MFNATIHVKDKQTPSSRIMRTDCEETQYYGPRYFSTCLVWFGPRFSVSTCVEKATYALHIAHCTACLSSGAQSRLPCRPASTNNGR